MNQTNQRRSRGVRGFTLIELLVVIGIIAILAAILLVGLNAARKRARDARIIANVSQAMNVCQLRADTSAAPDYTDCTTADSAAVVEQSAILKLNQDVIDLGSSTGLTITKPSLAPINSACVIATMTANTAEKFCRDSDGTANRATTASCNASFKCIK